MRFKLEPLDSRQMTNKKCHVIKPKQQICLGSNQVARRMSRESGSSALFLIARYIKFSVLNKFSLVILKKGRGSFLPPPLLSFKGDNNFRLSHINRLEI